MRIPIRLAILVGIQADASANVRIDGFRISLAFKAEVINLFRLRGVADITSACIPKSLSLHI